MSVILETFITASLSGFFFYSIYLPLPWVLGPLIAIMIWKNGLKRKARMPEIFRNGGLIILGYMMGSSFNRDTALQIARYLPSMMLITLCVVLFSLLLAFLVYKPMGINFTSAILGNMPGGLTQMVILCDDLKEASITIVTYMQSIRLLSVVFFVPFFVIHGLVKGPLTAVKTIASSSGDILMSFPWVEFIILLAAVTTGAWIAEKLRFPTPQMLGPVLVIAVFAVAGVYIPPMPRLLIIMAQITIGIYLGLSFNTANIKNLSKTTIISLISSLTLILFTFIAAYYLSGFFNMNITTAFLSTAPGGMSEMAVTALAVNADLSFVTAFQMFRLLSILIVVPSILKLVLPKILLK